ncbi:MAG TPA: hypothetical protein VN259_10505 [Xanthomonadales bacterium]|nr:hypothetical protein [Xanthomonadales bacterium]
MTAYQLLVIAHIAAGSVALITFWTAAIARKGSALHKGVGKTYLIAMLGILASALPMAVRFIAMGVIDIGIFLLYLVVITGTSIWLARRAIQRKRDVSGFHDRKYLAIGWVNLIAGLVVFAIGLARASMLLSTFCFVGIAVGIGMLRQARKLPTTRNWWLKEHYGAMLGNGVATHVAFLGIGMRSTIASFDQAWLQLVPWFLPLAVALIAGVYLDRRYGPRPDRAGPAITA